MVMRLNFEIVSMRVHSGVLNREIHFRFLIFVRMFELFNLGDHSRLLHTTIRKTIQILKFVRPF